MVIGSPIYNFGVPAKLKTWADQVARAGVTFKYTLNGPIGLLENKKAYVAIASGGTRVDSEIDFATPWLRQFLKFIGIDDVKVIFADQLNKDQEFIWQICIVRFLRTLMRHRGSTMETKLIKYEDLGAANHDWLNAHHHFSFGVTMTKIEWVLGAKSYK